MKLIKLAIIIAIVALVGFTSITIVKLRGQIKNSQVKIDSLEGKVGQLRIRFGQRIFQDSCSMCHAGKVRTDNFLLDRVVTRVGETYLRIYLTKQDSLVNSKDKYAIALKSEYGHQANRHNFKFTPVELDALIEYLK
jgi:hypothetical protein